MLIFVLNSAEVQVEKFKKRLSKVTTPKVIIAMHVPPFSRASWHMGRISEQEWLPWMTSKVTGEAILDFHEANPDKQIMVLCGHTHSSGVYEIDNNFVCYTGRAQYGLPRESGIVMMKDFSVKISTALGLVDFT